MGVWFDDLEISLFSNSSQHRGAESQKDGNARRTHTAVARLKQGRRRVSRELNLAAVHVGSRSGPLVVGAVMRCHHVRDVGISLVEDFIVCGCGLTIEA